MSVMHPRYALVFRTFVGAILQTNIKLEEKKFISAREHYIGELRRGLNTCNLKKKTYIESFFDEIEPLFKDFSGRCATVWEGKLCHGHPRLLEVVRLVCRISGAN